METPPVALGAEAPSTIGLQANPGGPTVRVQVQAVIEAARFLSGSEAVPMHNAGSLGSMPEGPTAGAGNASHDGQADDIGPLLGSIGDAVDGAEVVGDDPLSTLGAAGVEATAGAAPLSVSDSDGTADADTARIIERYMELVSALGITDAIEEVARDAGRGVASAVVAQLAEQAAAVMQLAENEPNWQFDDEESSSSSTHSNSPGHADFYRARLTDPLYPGARLSLLQYVTLLLHQRQAHTMRDQCVDELCRMQHELVLPEGNIMPPSLYLLLQVRRVLTRVSWGLEVQRPICLCVRR